MTEKKTPEAVAPQEQKDDVLGILSLVASLCGFAVVGLVLGLIGASKAKKEGRSVALSRTGWIIGLVFTVLGLLFILVILAAIPALQRSARETRDRSQSTQDTRHDHYDHEHLYEQDVKTF